MRKVLTPEEKQKAQTLALFLRRQIEGLGLTPNQFCKEFGEQVGLRQTTLSNALRGHGLSTSTLDRIAQALTIATGCPVTASSLTALKETRHSQPIDRPEPGQVAGEMLLSSLRDLPWEEKVRIAPTAIRVFIDAIEGLTAEPLEKVRILIEAGKRQRGLGSEKFAELIGVDPQLIEAICAKANAKTIGADWGEIVTLAAKVRDYSGSTGNLRLFAQALIDGTSPMDRLSRMIAAFMATEGLTTTAQLMGRLLKDADISVSSLTKQEREQLKTALDLILRAEADLEEAESAIALSLISTSLGFQSVTDLILACGAIDLNDQV